jgi:hypothetical protein
MSRQNLVHRSVLGASVMLLAAIGSAAPAFASGDATHEQGHHVKAKTLLKADLIGSLTSDPALFGVKPGGVDWTVSRSAVSVSTDGRVRVRVRELLVTSTGTNPVPQISASLVCNGAVVDTVGPVPFSPSGKARINDRFTVPDRCLAPAVLLNPLDRVGTYIAASGAAR